MGTPNKELVVDQAGDQEDLEQDVLEVLEVVQALGVVGRDLDLLGLPLRP